MKSFPSKLMSHPGVLMNLNLMLDGFWRIVLTILFSVILANLLAILVVLPIAVPCSWIGLIGLGATILIVVSKYFSLLYMIWYL